MGGQDHVEFAGHVPHTSSDLVARLTTGQTCSRFLGLHDDHGIKEGIPGTIVEAMAAGLPVVATLHAGIPAVIESEQHGLLVPERDVDALAAAFKTVPGRSRPCAGAAWSAPQLSARRDELDLVARTVELERIYARFTGASDAPRDPREGTRHLDRLGDVVLNPMES